MGEGDGVQGFGGQASRPGPSFDVYTCSTVFMKKKNRIEGKYECMHVLNSVEHTMHKKTIISHWFDWPNPLSWGKNKI